MAKQETLTRLEQLLESFLDRAVSLKEERLRVIDGINRLDDIARSDITSPDRLTDRLGDWFADHRNWLNSSALRPSDVSRIGTILANIRREMPADDDASPAARKIRAEIVRWQEPVREMEETKATTTPRLVLKRPAETAPKVVEQEDAITRFGKLLDRMSALFADFSGNKKHILSALDDSLRAALLQRNKDALLLSAYMIYFLRLHGYKVEPFVKRLKDAERGIKESG